jgi:homoserine kinase
LKQDSGIFLRLPATSANLGPGFDTLALALDLHLEIEAVRAPVQTIDAQGRNAEVCGQLQGNLLLETYRSVYQQYGGSEAPTLALTVRNGIPLGMGCGSSAASRLAGIGLASHFAGLRWTVDRMLQEAALLEHHPDNAAACCLGGFVAAGYGAPASDGTRPVQALSISPPASWHAMVVLPERPLATTASRAVLPESYPRTTIVENLQNLALLVAAFAQGNAALLASATADQMHQPFRGEVCPLLPRLRPLAGTHGILSVTLSGAGSGVLILLESRNSVEEASTVVQETAQKGSSIAIAEIVPSGLYRGPAVLQAKSPGNRAAL